jgi:RNA polymerase sigma-70 factor, ECF subfamily
MDSELSSPDTTTLRRSPDEDVLAALREGRVNALDVLYDRYAKQVYSLAYRILGNSEEAEDITQEIFLTLWKKDAYQTTRGSLKAFLVTLTRSRSIDKLRSQGTRHRFLQRWQRLSESEQETTSPPLDTLSLSEESRLLHQALADLSDSERKILEIAYYEEASQAEIAKRLNLPLGTVKSRSRQGLNKLRQRLQNSR